MPRKAWTRCPFPQYVERVLVDSHSLLLEPMRSALELERSDANGPRWRSFLTRGSKHA